MITTGGTIAGCVEALERAGARPRMTVAATHGLFVAGAGERLQLEGIGRIVVTDTLPQPELSERRTVVSVAPLLAAAVRRLQA
jgi:ribose-phosphate pyrophosphokinase